jgi:hypothetical protein
MEDDDHHVTDMYEFLDALTDVITSSDPAKRELLAEMIDGYANDCPEDFFWATGAQAPLLLHHLMAAIDSSCRPDAQSKPRPAIRLVDRKPQGE